MPVYVSKAGGVGLANVLTVDDLVTGIVSGSVSSITGSVLVTASFASPFISFSKGDGSEFALDLSSLSTPSPPEYGIQFNSGSVFKATGSFKFNHLSQSLEQGLAVTASGQYSHAEGEVTVAGGLGSHAEGGGSSAEGDYSHAEGIASVASGDYAHAEGDSTTASGFASHAEGILPEASGDYSHAEGAQTSAAGFAAHAEGVGTVAEGAYSHAEGFLSKTTGASSHAEGVRTLASGIGAHAEGVFTTASGDYSHAEGRNTIAAGAHQHVQGQYNVTSSVQSAFIIGNGISDANRSNLVFAAGSQVIISGSLLLPLIQSQSLSTIVVANTSSGELFYTTQAIAATASYVSSSNVFGPFGFDSIQTASYSLTASFIDGGTF